MAELELDGWWWCDQPGREEIRSRVDRATGRVVGTLFTCPHGTWGDLSEARRAHSIDVSEVRAIAP